MPSTPGWVSVCVGRRRIGAIPAQTAAKLGVRVGAVWTAGLAAACAAETEYLGAIRAATVLLRRGGLTEATLRDHLAVAGHSAGAIERAVSSLRAQGLLGTGRPGAGPKRNLGRGTPGDAIIDAKSRAGGHGVARDREIAHEAVRGTDPIDQAERLLRSRLAMRPPREGDESRIRRRLAALLARNGYDGETSEEALRRVMGTPPEID